MTFTYVATVTIFFRENAVWIDLKGTLEMAVLKIWKGTTLKRGMKPRTKFHLGK